MKTIVYCLRQAARLYRQRPRTGRRPKSLRPALERLEDRAVPSASTSTSTEVGYRPIDEVGNNVANPTLGTAGTDLLRVSPVAYADGIDSPSLPQNPRVRVISDVLNNQADPSDPSQDLNTVDQQSLSDFGYAFGQFIDHDLDLTPTNPNDLLQILADPNDPSKMGNQTFERSVTDPATGTSTSNLAQQINAVTSFLDLSNVYGSTQVVADALRTFSGGLLKTSPGNMLPYDNLTYFTQTQIDALNMANDAQAVPESSLFAAGDVRANENVELTALQTLFVRNHNLIATELQKEHPTWTDEQLYQEARKINIAEYQEIIYTQYLPDLLGPNALPAYTGYNAKVDPAIATEFSTAAFRFGHSLLSGEIERQGNNGQDVLPNDPAGASISLATDFFDPDVLNPAGAAGQPAAIAPTAPVMARLAETILIAVSGAGRAVAEKTITPASPRDEGDPLRGTPQGPVDVVLALPQAAGLLTNGLALDPATLHRTVEALTSPLSSWEDGSAHYLYWIGVSTWALAAALACEAVRREVRRRTAPVALPLRPTEPPPEDDA